MAVDVLPYLTVMTQTGMSSMQIKHALTGPCRIKLLEIVKASDPKLSVQSDVAETPVECLVKWKRKAEDIQESSKKPRQEQAAESSSLL